MICKSDLDEDDKFEEASKDETNPTPLPNQPKQNNPKPNPSLLLDAINLVNNGIVDQKIKISKLQNNQIDQLQKIRNRRLKQLQEELYEDNVMTLIQISMLFQIIRSKILKIQQNMEFNKIKTGIEKETNTTKLKVNWTFIGNLLNRNLHNTLIINNTLLSEEQKEKLYELRKQQIVVLNNKIYENLENNIKNKKIVSKLEDKRYYDSRIDPVLNDILNILETLDLSDYMPVEEFFAISKENIVYKVPSDNKVITDLVEIFRANEQTTIELKNMNNSFKISIVSANIANMSLKTIHIFLFQQNDTKKYINILRKVKKFIKKVKDPNIIKQN
ncbi:hypothetical protein C2G38_2162329 [Gigaspora rosea]|uniref:Uncharacterized protein n=1 Tax=Gigaspora rosea TaxID=44941 RepID=A0A397W3E0_9GLOM|nr:hypothetical protein C2G38_2162329 [Gigaspora rosea]